MDDEESRLAFSNLEEDFIICHTLSNLDAFISEDMIYVHLVVPLEGYCETLSRHVAICQVCRRTSF
jgi:hypothetical protein